MRVCKYFAVVVAALSVLQGCDFVRTFFDKPTSEEIERMRRTLESRRLADEEQAHTLSDSLALAMEMRVSGRDTGLYGGPSLREQTSVRRQNVADSPATGQVPSAAQHQAGGKGQASAQRQAGGPSQASSQRSAGGGTQTAAQVQEGVQTDVVGWQSLRYQVIAGLFKDASNADRLCRELNDKGYKAVIINNRRGSIVSLHGDRDKKCADAKLRQLKESEFPYDLCVFDSGASR